MYFQLEVFSLEEEEILISIDPDLLTQAYFGL